MVGMPYAQRVAELYNEPDDELDDEASSVRAQSPADPLGDQGMGGPASEDEGHDDLRPDTQQGTPMPSLWAHKF